MTIGVMTFDDVKSYYGSAAKAAAALNMERQSVYRWQEGVPELVQYKIHYLTSGALPLDPKFVRQS